MLKNTFNKKMFKQIKKKIRQNNLSKQKNSKNLSINCLFYTNED